MVAIGILARLSRLAATLAALVESCATGTVPDCPMIEALAGPPDAARAPPHNEPGDADSG